jgi:arsenical pump membrane protein
MFEPYLVFPLYVFSLVTLFIIWRPFGINESIPALIGALVILAAGIVPLADVYRILVIVSGASITIISTIVMSIVLESIGFFRWAALNLAIKSRGSGRKLFWNINLLCFLMTMFFNNDGSILITTPIIIQTLALLHLKTRQKIPYLLSGALIATGSSAPIGVSNLANLIALDGVGLNLNSYTAMMFIPSMLAILVIACLLYLIFKKNIPIKVAVLPSGSINLINKQLMESPSSPAFHPLKVAHRDEPAFDWDMFRICIFVVVITRASFFLLAPLGVSTEWPAIAGAVLLVLIRWKMKGIAPADIVVKTPWHILLFALTMYIIIYGLHNSGLTALVVERLGDEVAGSPFNAVFIMGLLLTVMSNLCNNLPSIMIGTLALQGMQLDTLSLQIAYLANILGADIGALILPMGTLASLIWLDILRKNNIHLSWGQYIKTTLHTVPIGLIIGIIALYVWTEALFR